MRRLLVAGGAGFFGNAAVERLRADGCDPVVASRRGVESRGEGWHHACMKRVWSVRLKTRAQGARALRERAANRTAARRHEPLPFPNPWDEWDPTKVAPGASMEAIRRRYVEFMKLCPRPRPKTHVL